MIIQSVKNQSVTNQIVNSQQSYLFLFKISILQINTSKQPSQAKQNIKKSILIKLGIKTQKITQLNQPVDIFVDVLYSTTLKRYCPIKGIIKIYDVNINGTQVIQAVGGFQTEDYLSFQKKDVLLEKDVGTSKIKLKMQIQNKGQNKKKPQSSKFINHNEVINPNAAINHNTVNIPQSNTKYSSQQNKKKLSQPNRKDFSQQIIMSQRQKQQSYQIPNNRVFCRKSNNLMTSQVQKNEQKNIIKRQNHQDIISKYNNQIQLLNDQLNKKQLQIKRLCKIEKQKHNLQQKLYKQQNQIKQLQDKLNQLIKNELMIVEQNKYLKQKDEKMQQIICNKQQQIQCLHQQVNQIDLAYHQLQSSIKNDLLLIQQQKQQISNLSQCIQSYREKYGDLKTTKSRAIQNQLKQCLMWIDQQARDLQADEDAITQHSFNTNTNVSQIIKSIQLEGATREQMGLIKHQLAGLIIRIDNFLIK